LAAEQYRLLRGRLAQEFSAGGILMLTSPGKGDGKTLTTLNLCSCLADSGDSTILVELDLRQPSVVNTLGCKILPPGIEDVMAGKAEARQAVHFIEELGLHVAVVCEVPRDPSQLVTGKQTQQFLEWTKENFRWVIVDSAPVVPAADVFELLPLVNGVVLVVRAEHTPKDLAKRALEMIGPRLHGVILNEATVDSNPYYRYMSQY
jgi:capsular exopolysaccharide synthesis family protein